MRKSKKKLFKILKKRMKSKKTIPATIINGKIFFGKVVK